MKLAYTSIGDILDMKQVACESCGKVLWVQELLKGPYQCEEVHVKVLEPPTAALMVPLAPTTATTAAAAAAAAATATAATAEDGTYPSG